MGLVALLANLSPRKTKENFSKGTNLNENNKNKLNNKSKIHIYSILSKLYNNDSIKLNAQLST